MRVTCKHPSVAQLLIACILFSVNHYVSPQQVGCQANTTAGQQEHSPTRCSEAQEDGKIAEFQELREPTAWRWKYQDEFVPARFSVLIKEKSIDERLANVLYTTGTSRNKINSLHFNSGSAQVDADNVRLIAGRQVDDSKCGQHLKRMLELMADLEARLKASKKLEAATSTEPNVDLGLNKSHIYLARVLDSFGRYESGYMSGRTHSMGAYLQCLGGKLQLGGNRPEAEVNTRFCWAHLSLNRLLDPQLRARRRLPNEDPETVISSGICVPESCHTRSFKRNKRLLEKLVNSQFKLPTTMYRSESLELSSIYCLIDDDSQLVIPLAGKLLIALMATWCLLVAYATIFGRNHSKTGTLIGCMDLNESWKSLTGSNSNTQQVARDANHVDFNALNPLKVLSTAYVVFGHVILYCWNGSANFLQASSMYETDRISMALMVGAYAVDMFFAMTGMLLAYNILKRLRAANTIRLNGLMDYLKWTGRLFVARYLRLVPMFYLMFWFKKSLIIYLGTNPYWDSMFDRSSLLGGCNYGNTWLDPLVPISGTEIRTLGKCLPQSWSVSSDIFFSVFIIPIILLIHKWPKLGCPLLAALCLYSLKLAHWAFQGANQLALWEVNELKANGFSYMLNELSYLYLGPQYRITSIGAGVFAGYALIKYNELATKEKRRRIWPGWFRNFVTYVALLLVIYPFVSAIYMAEIKAAIYPNHQSLYPSLSTTYRFIFAIAVSLVLVRIVTDWKEKAWFKVGNTGLWRILVKLDYAIFLIHMDVIQLSLFDPTSSRIITKYRATLEFFSVYSICLILGTLLHLVVECPLNKMIRRAIAH